MQLPEFFRCDWESAVPHVKEVEEAGEAADSEADHEPVAQEVVDVVQHLDAHYDEEPGKDTI